jgi:glycosyltransferase involved in cell wall biosynthesis
MYSIIAFATQWGSKYGGINTFNTDFLSAFGYAYHAHVQVICIVTDADDHEIEAAKKTHVTLVKLPYKPKDKVFAENQATAAVDELNKQSIQFEPASTVWLGHDRISGNAAIHAAKLAGGRSALIHHMSYDLYEAFAENSKLAYSKQQEQKALFKQADALLAVGPLLRDALTDLVNGNAKPVHMIIPGLAEITPKPTPNFFTAFLSGRLDEGAAKIKQGHLGVAAFATAVKEANASSAPKSLVSNAKMVLRGVDFESSQQYGKDQTQTNPESDLNVFAEDYAGQVINLHALPYTQDREELYDNLSAASVALMPSWHEGFGLVAWEAIAAGVPVIVSQNSGVYQFVHEFLKQNHPGSEQGLITSINVGASTKSPFFSEQDLSQLISKITAIANDPKAARARATSLREKLSAYTWGACVGDVVGHFGWNLQKETQVKPINPDLEKRELPINESVVIHTETTKLNVSQQVRAEVREEIRKLIARPAMEVVKETFLKVQIEDKYLIEPEKLLVPFDVEPFPITSIIDDWHTAVRDGLKVMEEQRSNQLPQAVTTAKEIFEWLLRLAVPDAWVSSKAQDNGHCLFKAERDFPENYPMWAELGNGRLTGIRPFLELAEDNFNVFSPNQITHKEVELGFSNKDALTGILTIIWITVEKDSPPTDQNWQAQLPIMLERKHKDGERYHITIPYARFAAISTHEVWDELDNLLKNFGVFVCATGTGEPMLIVPEDNLLAQIRQFLRLLRKYS